ncbi:MAG: AAA family ATPase [Desulforudis sp.]|jgi:ATP-dependent DNA helicase RecG|nr:MAG: AAA family ATPase [Desulforudis sp.]
MIFLADIDSLVRGGESETLEFKRTTGERREAARTIRAMLNHRGGRVIFGVEPDGRIAGQMVSDRTVEEVAQELSEIEPPVFPSIERVNLTDNRQLLVVTAQPGNAQPYSYRGHAYRRVGNTSQQLSRAEYNRILFERLHGDQRWENQPATGWSVSDLDTAEISRTLEESIRRGRADDPGTRDPAEMLRGFGLIKDGQILRAAVVLFGRAERIEAELPQGLLRVARFRGTDKTDFLDNRQFHGNAFDLLLKAERFLRENLPVAGRIQPNIFERVDDPLYPPAELREALANAFCHRDYSIGGGSISIGIYDDRLEITSTGTLHFGLTPEALYLPHESLPWNPLMARVFYRRGIIESWGRGTIKIAELVARAGLPPPEIEEASGCVVVRFRPSRYLPPQRVAQNVTDRQQRVLAVLAEKPDGAALREILTGLDMVATERQVREDLAILKALGLANSSGHGRGARWKLL